MENYEILKIALLVMLIVCAVASSLIKRTLHAVIAFTAYSLIMAIVWALLESPDLAVTEAAVGAGVSGVLFYMALHKIGRMEVDSEKKNENGGSGDDSPKEK